ncbi:head-tail joining protein [Salinicola sp. V024]|uniref:head-tail joining protein n=1 Tax=Salinicola sp. V024 TaxID=3459609 RepID=UPI004045182B
MSRFAKAMARANRVLAENLADGLATYRRDNGETIEGVPYELNLSFEVYKEGDQLPTPVKAVEVPVSLVPTYQRGDEIVIDGKTWEVLSTLTDDGDFRQLEIG